MYVPKHFKVIDVDEVIEFMRDNAFGIVVSTDKNRPTATHLPLQVYKRDEQYFITGHFAYGNEQWKTLENSVEEILVIFEGPHAYISSSWYNHENVSTWNYQAVHVYGRARILSEDELIEDLKALTEKYEHGRDNPVLWENMSEKTRQQFKGVVGFEIEISEVQAAYKLSQNRDSEDYDNIIHKLEAESDAGARRVADVMKKRK